LGFEFGIGNLIGGAVGTFGYSLARLRTFTTTGFHSWENPACITFLGVPSFNFMT